MKNISSYSVTMEVQVIRAYLLDAKSHRRIQEEILKLEAPARGGGFEAMKILHAYGIKGDKKGILKTITLNEEYDNAKGNYRIALGLLKGI